MSDHCGQGCCRWYNDGPENWSTAWGGAWGGGECGPPLYCIRTGAALTTVDGQPVVEPRPSPGYVQLLEKTVEATPDWVFDAVLPQSCTEHQCGHYQWLNCLRALAAKHEKEE